MKGLRQRKIREIISERDIGTQKALAEALRNEGLPVTQATISRDIKEMQLVKVPLDDGKYKYALPQDQRFNPSQKLRRALLDHFVSAEAAENLVVVKCLPATANTVASLIDGMNWPEVVGTVSGDDTLLIVCRSRDKAEEIAQRIRDIIS